MIWKIYFIDAKGQRSSAGVELGPNKQAAMDSAAQKGVRNVIDAIPL